MTKVLVLGASDGLVAVLAGAFLDPTAFRRARMSAREVLAVAAIGLAVIVFVEQITTHRALASR